MNTAETQQAIDRYFELMGRGENYAVCYAPDVSWTMVASGTSVHGADRVRAYIEALHAGMIDSHTVRVAVGDGWVYLEGHCAASPTTPMERLPYLVAYDLAEGLIVAMRCYGRVNDVEGFDD